MLWKLAQLLRPGSEPFKIALFAMLGILTVYYRTFSQPRGEPYVAFFTVFVFYWLFKMIRQPLSIRWKDGLVLGIALGLLILSRQWGFLIFPALAFPVILIFCKNRQAGVIFGRNILLAGLVAFLVGGWFYIHLYVQYGSFSAFNMNTTGFSFSNQPLSFYRNLHLKGFELFTQPVRPNFDNTLLPIFYSDTWGDYWGFFTYILRNSVPVATRQEMAAYLGRVNLASIFPSLIFLAGLAGGGLELVKSIRKKEIDPQATFQGFIFLAILFSWIGYMWFLISYPNPPTGNTNKATYMIQIFVMLPVVSAFCLERIRQWKGIAYQAIMILLLLVFIHNFPALITRFTAFNPLLIK